MFQKETRTWMFIEDSECTSSQRNTETITIYRVTTDDTPLQWHPTPVLAWKIPWMEEPGRLQSMGLLTVGHD